MPIQRKSELNGSAPGAAVITQVAPSSTNAKRMVLDAIEKSRPAIAKKGILYAPEGWGKTTWGSKCEKPVFLSPEEGLESVTVDRFPTPELWTDIFDAIDTLRVAPHDYKTLVIDTVDWTEPLCHAHIVKRDKKNSIEDYGWGKGYIVAFEEYKRLISALDTLRRERSLDILLLAHSMVRTFNNPTGENYDRFELKMDKRVSTLIKEWADFVLFGNYDIAVDIKSGQSKGKALGGERLIYANHSPSFDAKNRYGISEPISADADIFWSMVRGGVR